MDHFCNCPNQPCKFHPANHDQGCDPCIKSNLDSKKMSACFFLAVSENIDGLTSYSIDSFVEFYHRCHEAQEGKA